MPFGRTYSVYLNAAGKENIILLENTRNKDCVLGFANGVVLSLDQKKWLILKSDCNKICDVHACLGVLSLPVVETEGSFVQYLIVVKNASLIGQLFNCEAYRITDVNCLPLWGDLNQKPSDPRIIQIQKLLSCGLFLFGWSNAQNAFVDISLAMQRQFLNNKKGDTRFHWNLTLRSHLQQFGIDAEDWVTPCICGVIEVKTAYVGHQQAKACIISRISSERMGTRFNVRGVNDFGNVANFIETEQVIFYNDNVVSHVQVRGSVPLFWDQPGIQVGSHKIKINRSLEASLVAYEKHFQQMKICYGSAAIINLLGTKNDENTLSESYQVDICYFFVTIHSDSAFDSVIPFISFDLHSEAKGSSRSECLKKLWPKLETLVNTHGFFHCSGSELLRKQTGVLRVNCLDCLDRTNSVQSLVGLKILQQQLAALGLSDKANICTRFVELFKACWTLNGDHCSKLYTGTAAQEGKSKFKDASISVTRTIQGNLMDKSKQQAMNFLLRNSKLGTDTVAQINCIVPNRNFHVYPSIGISLIEKVEEFVDPLQLRLFCGTWNVNGGQLTSSVIFRNESSLADWLINLMPNFNGDASHRKLYDIYAIGLQEMVDLNASNVLNASVSYQNSWRDAFLKELNSISQYVLLETIQLVGICLFVFVQPELLVHIRDVSTAAVKTGFGGTIGNKGGTAISFTLGASSLCFICSHFTAGHSQVQERNDDYEGTCRRLRFPSGLNLFSHDFIFWFGDFNYRIDMAGEEVKHLVDLRDFDSLREADQLVQQKMAGCVFIEFEEGLINFAPTYKYDAFSDNYDTSEKARVPAWTDRIFFRKRRPYFKAQDTCQLLVYCRAELKTSDHRPVGAVFNLHIGHTNVDKLRNAVEDIVSSMGPRDATVLVSVQSQRDMVPFVDSVLEKIRHLGIKALLTKCIGEHLFCTFGKSEDAIAALSMDGVKIGQNMLCVRLKTTDWETDCQNVVNQLFNDDFDKNSNNSSLNDRRSNEATMSNSTAPVPQRPPPPKRYS
ncbi:Synaptojanin-1 [Trichinella sp. T6]|nr:Synaptojanin-1 [Trichinella sp. T6]